MANYTITLDSLLKNGYPLALNEYPIFNENYRNHLNKKIIDHFLFYEIGQETPYRFNHYLKTKMNEIMPYYNQLYISEMIKFDPLSSSFVEKEIKRENETLKDSIYSLNHESNETRGETTAENIKNDSKKDISSETSSNAENTGNNSSNGKNITVNDLETKSNSESSGTGHNITTGTKSTVFSDVPQSVVMSGDGEVGNGYATTVTNEKTNQEDNTETSESGNSTVTNKGTVTVTNETINDSSSKNVTSSNSSDHETSGYTQQNDRQHSTNINNKYNDNKQENQKDTSKENTKEYEKGRSGFSPSTLLLDYRKTFLNIDMMVINELKSLFMEVF
mgnify:CR=1 FL=1